MEIFMRNIGVSVIDDDLTIHIASTLHSPAYAHHANVTRPMNFQVRIFPRRRGASSRGQCGVVTVPTVAIGQQFLSEYGLPTPHKSIVIGSRIIFQLSNKTARQHVVEEIRRTPYEDPRARRERERVSTETLASAIALATIQFGWECRDGVYSIEWEDCTLSSKLMYDNDRREFRIELPGTRDTRIIAIRASQILWCSAGKEDASYGQLQLYLSLSHPPSFELRPEQLQQSTFALEEIFAALHLNPRGQMQPDRQRLSAFDDEHVHVAPFTSIAIRLLSSQRDALSNFRRFCSLAHIQPSSFIYPVERRGLFAPPRQRAYQAWLRSLPWPIAFQVEAILRALLVDIAELLDLRRDIEHILQIKGTAFTVDFLRHFATQAKGLFWYTATEQSTTRSIRDTFQRCRDEFTLPRPRLQRRGVPANPEDSFQCLHVTVTPTSWHLEGPYPERSNRVIRQYHENHDSFLRVNFVDETGLQYRFDRDVDGRSFIQCRVGGILRDGLNVAGRHFDFLAYSQSALKEHAVYFVKEFVQNGVTVNAATIIAGLGNFRRSDPRLIYCPARYGARISQAFTATDSSITVEAEEIFYISDVERDSADGTKWCFTDGVGTISRELAREIWRALNARRRSARRARTYARALQLRFQGSKGMVSVDYKLAGRAICIRPSMIKFEAPDSKNIEIARAFYRPGPFYLNRPLIMILEGLGVPYEVFESLQEAAVKDAQRSVLSLEKSARLLEAYGLGTSYKLTSVMLSLHKLGAGPPNSDTFWRRMMDYAINHVLRELKHHARIPVPDAWNLVGVADIHNYLEEGEVFGCIIPHDGSEPIYLEGPTMVSRSPTIHPGDVQIAHGMGRPPPGSPFESESLRNTLVFSIQGERPLPSFLGGGDLDGDEYRVTMVESMLPPTTYQPASYKPAERVYLDRPSTMEDVGDFVAEYITSDSLGIIATTWLTIADQSTEGIFDSDCLKLSDLHSDAVDYPKSGKPVPIDSIPKLKFRVKPDWSAPETVALDPNRYYESTRAIGRLFRAIDLPAVEDVGGTQRSQRRSLNQDHQETAESVLYAYMTKVIGEDDDVYYLVADHVSQFIPLGNQEDILVTEIWELFVHYKSQLETICADHSLSTARNAMLTEEEAVVGSIVAKCSQARRRRDCMSKMREHTSTLVDDVQGDLAGEHGTLPEKVLERAWVGFHLASVEALDETFGAKSFAWIAMAAVFEAIRDIESLEGYDV